MTDEMEGKGWVTIARQVKGPPHRVLEMWSTPEHLMQWWAPDGSRLLSCELHFSPGGAFRFCMRGPDGSDRWIRGAYREIVPGGRLVFGFAFEETTVSVDLEANTDDQTTLTLRHGEFDEAGDAEEYQAGWTAALDRLVAYAAKR